MSPSWEYRDPGRRTSQAGLVLTVCALVLLAAALAVGAAKAGRSAETVQGHDVHWWAARSMSNGRYARQEHRNSVKRGHTIHRLKAELRRGFIPWHWLAVGSCESGLRWDYNGRSGFDGALQFHPGTWTANRLPSYPRFAWQASPFQQLVVGELVLARQGWGAWPACSREVGLR